MLRSCGKAGREGPRTNDCCRWSPSQCEREEGREFTEECNVEGGREGQPGGLVNTGGLDKGNESVVRKERSGKAIPELQLSMSTDCSRRKDVHCIFAAALDDPLGFCLHLLPSWPFS